MTMGFGTVVVWRLQVDAAPLAQKGAIGTVGTLGRH